MMGKTRQKTASSVAESVTLTLNERILKDCHSLYTDTDNGLIKIASTVGLKILAPRKKITVLLIGNHSAGKSTFINWYIEEHVQKTGVAMETQGFSFVTSGRKRETLTGNATLHLYPHFQPLQEIEGVVDYLTTEISTSKQKKFSLVMFVDTPGLVDGDMKYAFDVNKAILWLGDVADLIFVFFDPIGQALCKRTLSLVEQLSERHADRLRFYLSKADEAGHEADRQRVLMQIVQELCKRPTLNRTAFDMPTIFIPNPDGKPTRCANQIEEVCKDVEKTINQMVQNTLNSLEKDCEHILSLIDARLEIDNEASSYNMKAGAKGCGFYLLSALIPLLLLATFLIHSASANFLQSLLGKSGTEAMRLYLGPVWSVWSLLPTSWNFYAALLSVICTLVLFIIGHVMSRRKPTLQRRVRRELIENREFVRDYVMSRKQSFYKEYLDHIVTENDL